MMKFICDCVTYLQNLHKKKYMILTSFWKFRKINNNHYNTRLSRTNPSISIASAINSNKSVYFFEIPNSYIEKII